MISPGKRPCPSAETRPPNPHSEIALPGPGAERAGLSPTWARGPLTGNCPGPVRCGGGVRARSGSRWRKCPDARTSASSCHPRRLGGRSPFPGTGASRGLRPQPEAPGPHGAGTSPASPAPRRSALEFPINAAPSWGLRRLGVQEAVLACVRGPWAGGRGGEPAARTPLTCWSARASPRLSAPRNGDLAAQRGRNFPPRLAPGWGAGGAR